MLPGSGREPRACRGQGRRGGAGRCGRCLPAGALPVAVLLPEGRRGDLRPRGDRSGPFDAAAGGRGAAGRRRRRRSRLREARARPVSQQRGRSRYGRSDRRPLSEDAHPRRSGLLREVLLHAGGSRLPGVRYETRPHRHPDLLGSVVSRRARGWRPSREQASSSTRPRSAGTLTRRRNMERRSSTRG